MGATKPTVKVFPSSGDASVMHPSRYAVTQCAVYLDTIAKSNLSGTIRNDSALTGTVSGTIDTNTLTGVGTLFLTELAVGNYIQVGSDVRRVASIQSDLILTVAEDWSATTAGVSAVEFISTVTGTSTLFLTEVTPLLSAYPIVRLNAGGYVAQVLSVTSDTELEIKIEYNADTDQDFLLAASTDSTFKHYATVYLGDADSAELTFEQDETELGGMAKKYADVYRGDSKAMLNVEAVQLSDEVAAKMDTRVGLDISATTGEILGGIIRENKGTQDSDNFIQVTLVEFDGGAETSETKRILDIYKVSPKYEIKRSWKDGEKQVATVSFRAYSDESKVDASGRPTFAGWGAYDDLIF